MSTYHFECDVCNCVTASQGYMHHTCPVCELDQARSEIAQLKADLQKEHHRNETLSALTSQPK